MKGDIRETNYKNAFIQCKKTDINCNIMKKQLDKVNDALTNVKNLVVSVNGKVNAEKKNISNYNEILGSQKNIFNDKLRQLNTINEQDQASGTLRKDRKKSMTYDYLTLTYYFLTNALIIYLLHKQYNFSSLYLLAVFLIILIVIFVLGFFGIPYA